MSSESSRVPPSDSGFADDQLRDRLARWLWPICCPTYDDEAFSIDATSLVRLAARAILRRGSLGKLREILTPTSPYTALLDHLSPPPSEVSNRIAAMVSITALGALEALQASYERQPQDPSPRMVRALEEVEASAQSERLRSIAKRIKCGELDLENVGEVAVQLDEELTAPGGANRHPRGRCDGDPSDLRDAVLLSYANVSLDDIESAPTLIGPVQRSVSLNYWILGVRRGADVNAVYLRDQLGLLLALVARCQQDSTRAFVTLEEIQEATGSTDGRTVWKHAGAALRDLRIGTLPPARGSGFHFRNLRRLVMKSSGSR